MAINQEMATGERMRKFGSRFIHMLAATVILSFASICSPSLAVGLGELRPLSVLDQSFAAYIEIYVSPEEDVKSLSVRMASMDEYQFLDLTYPFILSSVKAKISQQNGSWFVLLESENAVSAPLLTLVVQAETQRGVVSRQYDLMLDPLDSAYSGGPREKSVNGQAMKNNSGKIFNKNSRIVRPRFCHGVSNRFKYPINKCQSRFLLRKRVNA